MSSYNLLRSGERWPVTVGRGGKGRYRPIYEAVNLLHPSGIGGSGKPTPSANSSAEWNSLLSLMIGIAPLYSNPIFGLAIHLLCMLNCSSIENR